MRHTRTSGQVDTSSRLHQAVMGGTEARTKSGLAGSQAVLGPRPRDQPRETRNCQRLHHPPRLLWESTPFLPTCCWSPRTARSACGRPWRSSPAPALFGPGACASGSQASHIVCTEAGRRAGGLQNPGWQRLLESNICINKTAAVVQAGRVAELAVSSRPSPSQYNRASSNPWSHSALTWWQSCGPPAAGPGSGLLVAPGLGRAPTPAPPAARC